MRILFIHDRPSGGAGESLYRLCRHPEIESAIVFAEEGFLKWKFDELRDSVTTHYQRTRSWIQYRNFRSSLLSHLRVLLASPAHYPFFQRVKQVAIRFKPDLVFSNSIYLCEGALAARWLGLPHLWQVRELFDLDYYRYGIPKPSLVRWLSRLSRYVICNSNRTLATLMSVCPEIQNARVIHNIVDPPNETCDLREHLGLKPGVTLVATVGWITPNKRVEDFLAVANRLCIANVKFLVIGGWGHHHGYNRAIKDLIAVNRNRENVLLTGTIKDFHRYIGSLDVLLCPCYTESFGRTVGEALAAGIPAIGIRGSATEELIEHEKSGFLVKCADVDAMTRYCGQLIENKQQATQFGHEGRRRMMDHFSSSVLLPKFMALFQETVSQGRV